jgi:oligopeptide/dipeptide ABC transporter ATP-binding protein
MADLVDARSIAVSIGRLEVVSELTLRVGAGQAVGVVGESGSGKSVACRALTGTLGLIGGGVSSGRLSVCGQDMTDAVEGRWQALRGREVALVPQASLSGLDPLMRVGAQLRETVRVHDRSGDVKERARELMARVDLDPALLRRYPHELSGGQRQRVMIALALAGRPRLLIADEPTTALDVTVQRSILRGLRALCDDEGMGLVLVSHDMGVIEQVCDAVTVMYAGCSVETGRVSDVMAAPRHPYTAELLAARPTLDGNPLRGIDGMPPSPRSWPPGCRFAPRCAHRSPECTAERPLLSPVGESHWTACVHPLPVAPEGDGR